MKVTKVSPPISFKYNSILKDEWRQNPEMQKHVVNGLYGDKLTLKNISYEHLKPASKGGKTNLINGALATKNKNQARSNRPLSEFLTKEMFENYIEQFKGWTAKLFNNEEYIKGITKTVKEQGVKL